jgi:hypothetical protein
MLRRSSAGETLTSIGQAYGLTRERVRQIVKVTGVSMPHDSPRVCDVGGCGRPHSSHGNCDLQERRVRTHGSVDLPAAVTAAHGTMARYRGGCRCAECTGANRVEARARAHRAHPEWRWRAGRFPDEVPADARMQAAR